MQNRDAQTATASGELLSRRIQFLKIWLNKLVVMMYRFTVSFAGIDHSAFNEPKTADITATTEANVIFHNGLLGKWR